MICHWNKIVALKYWKQVSYMRHYLCCDEQLSSHISPVLAFDMQMYSQGSNITFVMWYAIAKYCIPIKGKFMGPHKHCNALGNVHSDAHLHPHQPHTQKIAFAGSRCSFFLKGILNKAWTLLNNIIYNTWQTKEDCLSVSMANCWCFTKWHMLAKSHASWPLVKIKFVLLRRKK